MRRAFILLTALLLCACVGGIRNTPSAVYDFGLPAERLTDDTAWSRMTLDVKSPPWFDSHYVDYRLAYDDPLRQREYAGSRWAGAPDVLLAQRLRQQLGLANNSANPALDCILRVDLQTFSQIFDSPQHSRGVVRASVSLIDRKRQLVAGREMTIDKPAITPDAHGGVVALVSASDELGQQLVSWLAELKRTDALRGCRLTPGP